jgi:FAD/FMN-containing dehydrogenase
MTKQLPPPPSGFSGRCVRRGIDENYKGVIYQYASSSYILEGLIEPRAVIFPTDDEDVFKAIKYAKDNNVGIAIRTGGHSYCGSSSTNGTNIQLDLSRTYTDFDWDNKDHTQVTLGISITLSRLQSRLRSKNRFLPTGQCSYVNLGGHLHTGGYGQQARAFGLLADYVQKVRIITAVDAEPIWVHRNVPAEQRLFRAILGGSPGNFGVVTHVTLKVLKDEDHPKSRGLRGVFMYTEERLKKILDVLVKQDDTEDTAGDYDLIISLMSRRDEEEDRPATAIVVFGQWANLGGEDQTYSSAFFDEVLEAGGGLDHFFPYHGIRLLGDEHVRMSSLCSHWIFSMVREYQLPPVQARRLNC